MRNKTKLAAWSVILCISVVLMGCAQTTDETTNTAAGAAGTENDAVTEDAAETENGGTTGDAAETENDGTREDTTDAATESDGTEEDITNVATDNDGTGEDIADVGTEEILEDDETIKNDMDSWIGKYQFDEVYIRDNLSSMFMTYEIEIYKEEGQYYADVVINGQMAGINLRAKLYGNEEWVSLVIDEYYPEHITGLSNMENSVILSLGRQGEEVDTYWGVWTPLLEDNHGASGKVYLERTTEGTDTETVNIGETDGLEDWIGEYAFSEFGAGKGEMFYDMTVYEENGTYYADLEITGEDTQINVKTQLYGDEQWASFALVGYDPAHKTGLENMENEVLFSLRKQGEDIYTYWGIEELTRLLTGEHYMTYYHTHYYFEKVEGQ